MAAILGVGALGAWALPWTPPSLVGGLVLLALPFALPAAWALAVVVGAFSRARFRAPLVRARVSVHLFAAAIGVVPAWFGMLFTSRLTIYAPNQGPAVALYAASLALAVVVGLCAARVLDRRAPGAVRRGRVDRAMAALFAALGLFAAGADTFAFPSGYLTLHEALWALSGLMFVATALVFTLSARRVRGYALGAGALMLVALAGTAAGSGVDARALALHSTISHRAFVHSLWGLLDRDGDGFAGRLDGGDCDDRDARTFPLSTRGRDCTGWRQGAPVAGGEARPPALVLDAPRPRVMLLLTVDALRCGFGGPGEQDDLRDACPALTRLGREGRLRLDGHTTATQTRWAIGSLLTGRHAPEGPPGPGEKGIALARELGALGYDTHAIPTCRYAADAAGARFQTVDESLIARARPGGAVTAPDVNEAVLDRVRRALAPGGRPLFLWAHYMDPHAPYVDRPGLRWVWTPRANYPVEIRRTDAALGELTRALEALPGAEDVLVFVTADHGEELGEHGFAFHGAQVYEESIRVPMLAWSAGADHRRFLGDGARERLPGSVVEVGAFLMALATRTTFQPAPAHLAWAPLTGAVALVSGTRKLIYHPRLGQYELYDLARDPGERVDLAPSTPPAQVASLGRTLAALAHWLPVAGPPGSRLADETR